MDLMEAIKTRHSVRDYTGKKIEGGVLAGLQAEIEDCNKEGGLHIQLITGDPETFGGLMAHYGKFNNVQNYVALIGKKDGGLDEKIGYYGERIVLKAQQLGLNTCWVALTFRKGKCKAKIAPGEKLVCVLSIGYGKTQGAPHKSKPIGTLYKAGSDAPEWFLNGMEAALLAPTAVNQQKFFITLAGDRVSAKAGNGFYAKVDLGIIKYHFEIGAGTGNFVWD